MRGRVLDRGQDSAHHMYTATTAGAIAVAFDAGACYYASAGVGAGIV